MERTSEYLGVLVILLFSAGIAGGMYALNQMLGPKRKASAVKAEPFECGVPAQEAGAATPRVSVKFYLVAMLFILFDIEIIWLFPWAVLLRELGWVGILEMFSFLAVLALGFGYAWKKGALEWQK